MDAHIFVDLTADFDGPFDPETCRLNARVVTLRRRPLGDDPI
jgi:hypothetical protein